MSSFEHDLTLAGSFLLGQRANQISSEPLKELIFQLCENKQSVEQLAVEMCVQPQNEFERCNLLLSAFLDGFFTN